MLLDNVSDGREQAWHVFAVHPGAAPWIEDRLKFFDDKGDIAAAPENRADHAGERNRPGVMLQVLRIYEDLEGAALAAVERVVEGDIDGMIRAWPFQLVGEAGEDRVARGRKERPANGRREASGSGSAGCKGTAAGGGAGDRTSPVTGFGR